MTSTILDETPAPSESPGETSNTNGSDQPRLETLKDFDPLAPDETAPYGYRIDKAGNRVPKRSAGRPRTAGRKATVTLPPERAEPITRPSDAPPDAKSRSTSADVPYQKGFIKAGITKLYKRAGRIVQAMDKDIGVAIVESADECGEAWEDLARVNPRVRAFLMKLLKGSGWSAVFMAHLPILMAILMKEGIRKHIPILNVMGAALEDEDGAADISEAMGGLTPEDLKGMMGMAQTLMGGMVPQNGTENSLCLPGYR